MRPARSLTEEQKQMLGQLLHQAKTKADFQRAQCLWLRAALNLDSAETALAVGWKQSTVRIIQSRYLREGEKVLIGKGRGGKRYSILTLEEEEELLASFLEKARAGGVLVIGEVKAVYEQKAGKKVPKSTIYRMLARHGWRKIMPRPRHPKTNPAVQEDFKKNSLRSSRQR